MPGFARKNWEALELLRRGKDVFCVLRTGFDKSLIYQMQKKSSVAKKGGSVGITRLLPHAKMLLGPMNCFLCRE